MSHLARVSAFAVVILLAASACASSTGSEAASGPPNASPTTAAAASAPPSESPAPSASEAPSASTASEEPSASTATGPAFADITLKGKGKKVAKFTIPEGSPAIAAATHVGKANFSIVALGADGSQNGLLVNTIGNYKGTVLFDQHADEHSVAFQIEADGAWTVVIKPVTEARSWDGASVLKGTSDDVVKQTPPSSGLATLDLTYKGKGNFAVIAYTADSSDLLANEIGNFTGQVLLPSGTVLLEVTAEGAWTGTPG